MLTYEELQIENENLNIQELDLSEVSELKGLYIDGNIAIHNSLSETEKACVLAEELGHHYTSSGNILNLNIANNRKQEYVARLWAYKKQVGISNIIKAYEYGCNTLNDTAEFLNVTEEFLIEALECYRQIYGDGVSFENYRIKFEPYLQINKYLWESM
ncbi:hypothetical protein CRH03_16180 [Clostridium sp. HMb25]|nr:hypothetical protein CRH03_16180 [Clostridium sp. HMb25]